MKTSFENININLYKIFGEYRTGENLLHDGIKDI